MGHTRGGGIGNMAGSYDRTHMEVEVELRQRGGMRDVEIRKEELNLFASRHSQTANGSVTAQALAVTRSCSS